MVTVETFKELALSFPETVELPHFERTFKKALEQRVLMEAYKERPAYQQNDYIGWINAAKRQETKAKRLRRMLDELEAGGVYMNMKHPPSRRD